MKKFKRAVTDSETGPGRCASIRSRSRASAHLLEINAAVTGRTPQEVAEGHEQYGSLKVETGEAVVALLEPIQVRYQELMEDRGELARLLRVGAEKARTVAAATLDRADECDRHVARLKLSPIDRRIVRLGIPALGTLAVEPLYRLVDTAIVGRIGTDELVGVAIAVTVITLVVSGANFLTTARPSGSPTGSAPAASVEAADVGVQAMWLSVARRLIATAAAVRARSGPDRPARCGRRRPATSRCSTCASPCSASRSC